jgi:hypothetical protein
MFQKTPYDTDNADILGQSGYAGAQTAGITNDQVNYNSSLGSLVEGLDNVAILKSVYLELNCPSAMLTVKRGFALYF